MSRKYFGTDGIRGRVGVGMMTAERVLKLGWAVGRVLASHNGRLVVIGKDTRISGYMFESALEAGLSAAGVSVRLLGPMPTPGIAYLTRTLRASAGIVISASHNPYYDNGIKLFTADGSKLPDEVEREIEEMVDAEMVTVDSKDLGKAARVEDAHGRYIEACKATIPLGTTFNGIKVVLDCANGSTYNIAPSVFRELGAKVRVIGAEPDGMNINDEIGSTHPAALQEAVKQHDADLGIAFDGDGDRVMMVDREGELVDGDELLYIIAKARLNANLEVNGVVGTLMTNMGMELALKDLGVGFTRAKVGDRYVMEAMRKNNWYLGGESSGHIICLDRTTTGDGIVSALQIMAYLAETGQDLVDAKAGMSKMPQHMINVPLNGNGDPMESEAVKSAVAEAERVLNGRGRVLLRPSGTEPLIRVMVEADDLELVHSLSEKIAETVRNTA